MFFDCTFIDFSTGLSFPVTQHGYYHIIYGIEGAGASAQAVKNLNVMDTLQSISLVTSSVTCEAGGTPNFSNLNVKALYSFSGESTVPAGSYTVDTTGVDFNTAGTYTATVSFTAPYGGTKTAPLTVTVTEHDDGIDHTSVSLKINFAKEKALVGIGYSFTLPDVTVSATDAKGKAINLADKVTFTVYHGDVTHWDPLNGLTDVKNTAAARKIAIDRHGFYKVIYHVQNGSQVAEAEFHIDVQDTVTGLVTDSRTEPILVHPGDAIDLSEIRIEGVYSYTGQRVLKPSEYTVSPAKAPNEIKTFQVTVQLTGTYDNAIVTKTVTIPFKTVSADTPIDKTHLSLTLTKTEINIGYRIPITLPDAKAVAALENGTQENLYNSITWSAYHYNADGWGPVANYQDVSLAGEGGRDFTPMEHGYYRIVYTIIRGDKSQSETLSVNIKDTLTAIEANLTKVKTVYAVGENLDLSGLVVHRILSYTGQSNVPDGEYAIDRGGYNANKVGDYTVTLSYTSEYGGKKTTSFTVSVIDPVTDAKLTVLPAKTVYAYGEPLDLTDAQATVQFSAAGTQTVPGNELEITGYDSRVPGKQTVSVLYRGVLAGTVDVTVNDTLFALDIDASTVKKSYSSNDTLDLTGLTVTGIYASGARRTLSADEYTADPTSFAGAQSGSYTVRIHVKDAAKPFAAFRVEVSAQETKSAVPFILLIVGLVLLLSVTGVLLYRRKKHA